MRPVSIARLVLIVAISGCGGSSPAPVGPPPGNNEEAAPAKVVIYTGNNQNGPAGSQLPGPLCTNVLDAAGHLLHHVVVTYRIATGGGSLGAPTSPSTDSNGIATSGLWTLGSGTGPQTVTASVAGAGSVTFTATAR